MKLRNRGDNYTYRFAPYALYCPECKACGSQPHRECCQTAKEEISVTARLPRKIASRKKWKKFYKKFVLQEELKEWVRKDRWRQKRLNNKSQPR